MCGKINDEDVKRFWDSRAKEYGKTSITGITNFRNGKESSERDEIERKALARFLDRRKHRKILDIGCGVGRLCMHLSMGADSVVGVDYSKPLIDVAEKERKKASINNVRYICASSTDFACDEKFDLIIISGLFIYINDNDVDTTIENSYIHLKKGGMLILRESVGVDERFEVINKYSEKIGTVYNGIYRTPNNLIESFERKGFRCIHDEMLFQPWPETATWFFVFEK
ncbi:MAG: methyltransferase domain-containing protein [Candidatus Aenigmarchaeota archaeon]|nr:methyltransferase domain-containing protein [Candidatus Aenigmarchaeota archaeon]